MISLLSLRYNTLPQRMYTLSDTTYKVSHVWENCECEHVCKQAYSFCYNFKLDLILMNFFLGLSASCIFWRVLPVPALMFLSMMLSWFVFKWHPDVCRGPKINHSEPLSRSSHLFICRSVFPLYLWPSTSLSVKHMVLPAPPAYRNLFHREYARST